jgi:hypothetical protein
VSGDAVLFGDDQPADPLAGGRAPSPIADWQIDLLRKALDARGLISMEDRQRAVQDAAGRPIESLRSLTHDEGMQVLKHLGQKQAAGRSETSAWDDRGEDTWIDRL